MKKKNKIEGDIRILNKVFGLKWQKERKTNKEYKKLYSYKSIYFSKASELAATTFT